MAAGFGLLALLFIGLLAGFIVDQTASLQAEAGPQMIAEPAPGPVEAVVAPDPDVENPEQAAVASEQRRVAETETPKAPASDVGPKPAAEQKPKIVALAPQPVKQPEPKVIASDDPRWARAAATNAAAVAALNKQVPPPVSTTLAATAFAGPEAIAVPELQIGASKIPVPTAKPTDDPVVTAAIAGGMVKRPAPVPSDPSSDTTDIAPPQVTRQVTIRTAVNMRSRPADESSVITVVPTNATVGLVGCKSWCEIVFNNRRGFVYKGFIRQTAASPAATAPKAPASTPKAPSRPQPNVVPVRNKPSSPRVDR